MTYNRTQLRTVVSANAESLGTCPGARRSEVRNEVATRHLSDAFYLIALRHRKGIVFATLSYDVQNIDRGSVVISGVQQVFNGHCAAW